jgi:hypothetical protein
LIPPLGNLVARIHRINCWLLVPTCVDSVPISNVWRWWIAIVGALLSSVLWPVNAIVEIFLSSGLSRNPRWSRSWIDFWLDLLIATRSHRTEIESASLIQLLWLSWRIVAFSGFDELVLAWRLVSALFEWLFSCSVGVDRASLVWVSYETPPKLFFAQERLHIWWTVPLASSILRLRGPQLDFIVTSWGLAINIVPWSNIAWTSNYRSVAVVPALTHHMVPLWACVSIIAIVTGICLGLLVSWTVVAEYLPFGAYSTEICSASSKLNSLLALLIIFRPTRAVSSTHCRTLSNWFDIGSQIGAWPILVARNCFLCGSDLPRVELGHRLNPIKLLLVLNVDVFNIKFLISCLDLL